MPLSCKYGLAWDSLQLAVLHPRQKMHNVEARFTSKNKPNFCFPRLARGEMETSEQAKACERGRQHQWRETSVHNEINVSGSAQRGDENAAESTGLQTEGRGSLFFSPPSCFGPCYPLTLTAAQEKKVSAQRDHAAPYVLGLDSIWWLQITLLLPFIMKTTVIHSYSPCVTSVLISLSKLITSVSQMLLH